MPSIGIVMAFVVLRRAGNFAFARPTREVLFTSLDREDKYTAKSFIDTFVYRLGDQVGAWSSGTVGFLNLGVTGLAWVALPLSLVWVANGWWLGRRQETMAAAQESHGAVPFQPMATEVVSAPPPPP
jgi:AAA family ATP:ADP antiporter